MLPSSTVENYLKAIHQGQSSLQRDQRLVPMGQVATALGVTPGTYEWTWGDRANQNFTLVIGVPGPIVGAGLPGLILGFAGIGFMAYRRKSKSALMAA